MNSLERKGFERVLAKASEVGIEVPSALIHMSMAPSTAGGRQWALLHPDDIDVRGCCFGEVNDGPEGCTCWEAVYAEEQLEPAPGPLECQPAMCGDCAYRPGSPERSEAYMAETLMDLPASGEPFFCHAGMRRPLKHVHPDGREVPGDKDDYVPGRLRSTHQIVYRANGEPALLCAGWAAHRRALGHQVPS